MSTSPRSQAGTRILAASSILILLVLGVVTLSWPTKAAERDLDPDLDSAVDLEQPVEVAPPVEEAPLGAMGAGTPEYRFTEPVRPREGAMLGSISGLVHLGDKLRDEPRIVTLLIEEAVNRDAKSSGSSSSGSPELIRKFRTLHTKRGQEKLLFEEAGLPFSSYGWRVAILSRGCNGSEEILQLGESRPDAQVELSLSRGIPVSLVVRDQNRFPLDKISFTLKPVGRPLGRPLYRGATNSYGNFIIEEALAGSYELIVGPVGNPLLPRRKIQIGRTGHHYENLVLPRGGSISFNVFGPFGNGIEGVAVDAIARDSKIYRKYSTVTKKNGRATLEHVPPGAYHIHLTKKGFARGFRRESVDPEGEKVVNVQLRADR